MFCKDDPRAGDLSPLGKKCLRNFHTYGCGTANVRSNIRNFTLKSFPPSLSVNAGADGERRLQNVLEDSGKNERTEARKKRKGIVSR